MAARIAAAVGNEPNDVVVEIGPGRGALTRRLLAESRRLFLIELDPDLVVTLKERFGSLPNVTIVRADARRFQADAVPDLVGKPYKVVGNLPYYAASPIIRNLLESRFPPTEIVVMVQREVAKTMAAAPGEMGMLSVATQLYAEPKILFHVPPRAFAPPPKVHSSVVRLIIRGRLAIELDSREAFFGVVRAGFAAPRKTVANSLAQGMKHPASEIARALEAVGIDPDHLKKIFDPGFTTKGVGVGTGLGLSICYQIIQDHHGTIDAESSVGEAHGTTFTIRLPLELDKILGVS